MGLINNVKKNIHRLASYQAGRRFTNNYYYAKESRNEHLLRSYGIMIISVILIVVGLIASLTPILPGSVLYVPGAVMLTARSKYCAKILDKSEVILHRFLHRFKKTD